MQRSSNSPPWCGRWVTGTALALLLLSMPSCKRNSGPSASYPQPPTCLPTWSPGPLPEPVTSLASWTDSEEQVLAAWMLLADLWINEAAKACKETTDGND